MGEFFKGWRRKAGLLTLLLACVFVSGLFGTLSGGRQLGVGFGDSDYILTSTDGFFRWTRGTLSHGDTWGHCIFREDTRTNTSAVFPANVPGDDPLD
jgi:hypothetical protein